MIHNNHNNRLPLYFTATMTIMFMLVGTVLLFQILKIQSAHVDMEGKQDLLLQKLEANQKEILNNQAIFKNLSMFLNNKLP